MYDVGSLLAVDCEAAGNFLKESAKPSKDAGQGLLAVRRVGADEMVGY